MAGIPMFRKPLEERNWFELFRIPLTPEENERYSDEDILEQFVRVGRPLERFLKTYLEDSGQTVNADGKYSAEIEKMLAAAANLD